MLKEITLSNGKVIRVLEADGYNDGYYWDMSATVEIDGDEYTIQDTGSVSGYYSIFKSIKKHGPYRLTGTESTPVDVNKNDRNWSYIFGAIKELAEAFFENNAKESYKYYDDNDGNYSTRIDGIRVGIDEEIKKYDPYTDKFIKNTTTDRIEVGTDGNLYRLSISNGNEYLPKDKLYTNIDIAAMLKELKYDLYHALCHEIHGKEEDCPCTNQTTSCLAKFRVCDANRAIGKIIQEKIDKLKGGTT